MTESDDDRPPFIETIGEARYEEKIQTFVAHVNVVTMSTRKTGAAERGGPFVRRCLEALFSAGLQRTEVEDAGLQLDSQWWNRRQNRSTHRFIIRTGDIARLVSATEAVEHVGKQKKLVTVHMQQPVFSTEPRDAAKALRDAVGAARKKAEAIAAECNLTLGSVVRVEEQESTHRKSGFLGDEDLGFAYGALRRRGGPGVAAEPLDSPARTVTVSVRVRFAVAPGRESKSPQRWA